MVSFIQLKGDDSMDDVTYKVMKDQIANLTYENKLLKNKLYRSIKSRRKLRKVIKQLKDRSAVCVSCRRRVNSEKVTRLEPYKKLTKKQLADLSNPDNWNIGGKNRETR